MEKDKTPDIPVFNSIMVPGHELADVFEMVSAVIDKDEPSALRDLKKKARAYGANAIVGQTYGQLKDGPDDPPLRIIRGLAVRISPK